MKSWGITALKRALNNLKNNIEHNRADILVYDLVAKEYESKTIQELLEIVNKFPKNQISYDSTDCTLRIPIELKYNTIIKEPLFGKPVEGLVKAEPYTKSNRKKIEIEIPIFFDPKSFLLYKNCELKFYHKKPFLSDLKITVNINGVSTFFGIINNEQKKFVFSKGSFLHCDHNKASFEKLYYPYSSNLYNVSSMNRWEKERGNGVGYLKSINIDFDEDKIEIDFPQDKNLLNELFEKLCGKEQDEIEKLSAPFKSKLIEELEKWIEIKTNEQNAKISREKKLVDSKLEKFSKKYDKDNNNRLDILEEDGFGILLKKNQSKIIAVDKSYIQKFVKLSMYLKTKSANLQKTFDLIVSSKKIKNINKLQKIFDTQYESFCLTLFRSYEMILSLIQEDLITFYEFYEVFDNVDVFESKWESDMKNTLKEIKTLNDQTVQGLLEISAQLQSIELNIIGQLSTINSSIEDVGSEVRNVKVSIDKMNKSLTKELKGINNKLWWNNVLQAVQIYQNRRTNKLLSR